MDTTPKKPSENGQPGSLRSGDLFGVSERALNQADCDLAARSVTKEELATLRTENRELRIMCAISHCGLSLYHDDGELQDSREYPWIDWKRDPVAEIEAKLHERAMRRMRAESERRGIGVTAAQDAEPLPSSDISDMREAGVLAWPNTEIRDARRTAPDVER